MLDNFYPLVHFERIIAPAGVNIELRVGGVSHVWTKFPSSTPLTNDGLYKVGADKLIVNDFAKEKEGG